MNEDVANCVKTANERILDSDEEEVTAEPAQELRTEVAQVAATKTSPPHISAPREEVVPWDYAISAQAPGRSRVDDINPQPGSYLSHISSSSYDLPEPNNHDLVRRYRYTVGEVIDQSRSMRDSHQSRVTEERTHEQQQQNNRQRVTQQQQQQHVQQPSQHQAWYTGFNGQSGTGFAATSGHGSNYSWNMPGDS